MAMPRIIKKIPGYDRIRDTIWYFLKYKKKRSNIQSLDRVFFYSFEKHPDKTFYIIRMLPLYPMMLFSCFYYILGHIIFAIENGYIPVVDLKNYHTGWTEDNPVNGTSNAWEYYFKQPTEYTLNDAYSAKNTLLSSLNGYIEDSNLPSFTDTDKISARHAYISKFMQIRPDVLVLADKQYELLFAGHSNVVGVMHRMAYKSVLGKQAENHPVFPPDDIFLEKTRELFTEWNMDYVCLSSNDRLVVDMFRDVFGEKLLVTDRARFNDPGNPWDYEKKYLTSLEYLVDVILLSKCDTFVSSMSGGTMGVLDLNNNQFKHKYMFPSEIFHGDESNSRVYGVRSVEIEVSERFYDALKKVQ